MLKRGDRVVLWDDKYGVSSCNPVWEQYKEKVVGTVSVASKSDQTCEVDWDNGERNGYEMRYLKLYKDVKEGDMKDLLKQIDTATKPYQKPAVTLGVMLAVDYFLLDKQFTKRVVALTKGVLDRAAQGVDIVTDKVAPDTKE